MTWANIGNGDPTTRFSARELREGFRPRHGDQRRGTRPEAGPDRSRRLRDLATGQASLLEPARSARDASPRSPRRLELLVRYARARVTINGEPIDATATIRFTP